MKISELFGKAGINYPQSAENIEISEIVTDSRRVREGSLFICINGLHHDGHEHIGEAISAGAKVIVAEQVRDGCVGGAATICVDNTRQAAALLYNAWYGDPSKDMTLVAVTGTNGKTSVCYILKRIFEHAGYRCGLIGTVSCMSGERKLENRTSDPLANMTTPDPDELYRLLYEMKKDGVEYVFMEATSHALALSKLDALRFDTAIFTNLTQDHLDFHGDMDGYFKAKSKLFGICRRAVINVDDKWAEKMITSACCGDIYTTSQKGKADFNACNIEYFSEKGSRYLLKSGFGEAIIYVPLTGSFFVMNTLQAAVVAMLYGIPVDKVSEAIASINGIDGRMEAVDLGDDAEISVIIDYAHTPDALENLLKSIRETRRAEQRIVLLFGCGGERDRGKRREMAQIASRLADVVVVTSDNSRGEDPQRIFSDILKGIDKEKEFFVIKDRESAIETTIRASKKGDVIVLAGKGHERYEIDASGRRPFDERKIAKDAYMKLKDISGEF